MSIDSRDRVERPAASRPAARLLVPVVVLAGAAVAAALLAQRSSDWLAPVARVPAFVLNPDLASAIAAADWLAPAIRGGSFAEAIGVAILTITVVGLIALHLRARSGKALAAGGRDRAPVYKIVTNRTKADDRRSLPWDRLTPSPVCERIKSAMCG
jgi:hypothetical protein